MFLLCPCCQNRTFVDEQLTEHLTRCDRCQSFVQLQAIYGASDGQTRYRLVPIIPTMVLAQTDHPVVLGRQATFRIRPSRPSHAQAQPQEARLRQAHRFTLCALAVAVGILVLAAATFILKINTLTGPRQATAHTTLELISSHP